MKIKSDSVFIVDGARTAIGNPFKSFKKFSAVQLASFVVKELVERNKIEVQIESKEEE